MDRLTKLEGKMAAVLGYLGGAEDHDDLFARVCVLDAEPTTPTPTESTPSPAPPRKGSQAYGDGRISVWREVEALLADSGTDVTHSIPDRIRALIAERNSARASRDAESRRAMAAESERDDARSVRSRMEQHLPNDTLGLDVWDAVAKVVKDRDAARAEVARLKNDLQVSDRINGQYVRQAGDAQAAAQRAESDLSAARAEIARLEARDRDGRWLVATENEPWDDIHGPEHQRRRAAYLAGTPPPPDLLLVEARELLAGVYDTDFYSRRDKVIAKLDARIGGAT